MEIGIEWESDANGTDRPSPVQITHFDPAALDSPEDHMREMLDAGQPVTQIIEALCRERFERELQRARVETLVTVLGIIMAEADWQLAAYCLAGAANLHISMGVSLSEEGAKEILAKTSGVSENQTDATDVKPADEAAEHAHAGGAGTNALSQSSAWRGINTMLTDPKSDWRATGAKLVDTDRALPWQRGDWYLAGVALARAEHPELLHENDPRASGIVREMGQFLCDEQEWRRFRDCAVTAKAFKVSRRRDSLSFAHHATLAPLPTRKQESWLDKCEKEKWSVADLREQIRQKLSPATLQPVKIYLLAAKVAEMLHYLRGLDLARDPDRRAAIAEDLRPIVEFAETLKQGTTKLV